MKDAERPSPTKVSIYLHDDDLKVLDVMRTERGLTRTALLRQALGVLQTMREATKEGYLVGACRDRSALDVLIIAP